MATIPDLSRIRSLHDNHDRNLQIGRIITADDMSVSDALVPTRSAILTYLTSLNIRRGLALGSAAYENVNYATLQNSVKLVTGTSLLNYLSSLNINTLPLGTASTRDVGEDVNTNAASLLPSSAAVKAYVDAAVASGLQGVSQTVTANDDNAVSASAVYEHTENATRLLTSGEDLIQSKKVIVQVYASASSLVDTSNITAYATSIGLDPTALRINARYPGNATTSVKGVSTIPLLHKPVGAEEMVVPGVGSISNAFVRLYRFQTRTVGLSDGSVQFSLIHTGAVELWIEQDGQANFSTLVVSGSHGGVPQTSTGVYQMNRGVKYRFVVLQLLSSGHTHIVSLQWKQTTSGAFLQVLEPFNSTTRAAVFSCSREAVGTYRITMAEEVESNAFSVLTQCDGDDDNFVASKVSVNGNEFVVKTLNVNGPTDCSFDFAVFSRSSCKLQAKIDGASGAPILETNFGYLQTRGGLGALLTPPPMGVHYSATRHWELITVVGPADVVLGNAYTGEIPEGAPPVLTPIQSLSGVSDGSDIELHIVVLAADGTQHHLHYKNAPLSEIFDVTRSAATSSTRPIFSRFHDSDTWDNGRVWLGDDTPLQAQDGAWSFAHSNNTSTRGFTLSPGAVVMGDEVVTDGSSFAGFPGNASKWISVSVFARRRINQSDCIYQNDLTKTRYMATYESGFGVGVDFRAFGPYASLPPYVERLMPAWGTAYINETDNGELHLTRRTLIFMLRAERWEPIDGAESLSDWTYNGGPDFYIHSYTTPLIIYSKIVDPGTYYLDNNSACYLFCDDRA